MSQQRTMPAPISLDKMPRGPNGRRLCRWCSTEVPKGRISFCSEACVTEFTIRRSPTSARNHVFRRDKGICAACGMDTEKFRRVLRHASDSIKALWEHPALRYSVPWGWRASLERSLGFDPHRRTYWDADHREPVHHGGGECGLDNYQTLCQPCHKAKTAAQRKKKR